MPQRWLVFGVLVCCVASPDTDCATHGSADWNTTCLVEFLEALAACAHHRAGTTLAQCTNLACGGTGSGTLAKTLGAVSAHAHHLHGVTIGGLASSSSSSDLSSDAPAAPPPCVIVTLREPAARAESGYRYTEMRRRAGSHTRRDLAADVREWRRRAADAAPWWVATRRAGAAFGGIDLPDVVTPEVQGANFGRSQIGYLLGHACGVRDVAPTELHVLCTERLSDDVEALGAAFGEPLALRSENRRAPPPRDAAAPLARAKSRRLQRHARPPPGPRPSPEEVARRSRVADPALRRWLNHVAYPADTALHEVFCGAPRAGGIAAIVAAGDAQRRAALEESAADFRAFRAASAGW